MEDWITKEGKFELVLGYLFIVAGILSLINKETITAHASIILAMVLFSTSDILVKIDGLKKCN